MAVGEETFGFLTGVEEEDQEECQGKLEEGMMDHMVCQAAMSVGCVTIWLVIVPNSRLPREAIPSILEINQDLCKEAHLLGLADSTSSTILRVMNTLCKTMG